MGMAAAREIDVEALAAAHLHVPDDVEIAEDIDERYVLGGPLYSHFPRHAYATDEEEQAARESRLDNVRWSHRDEYGEYADREAEVEMQSNGTKHRGHGGGGGGRNRKAYKPVKATRHIVLPEKPKCAVYPFCVSGILRGSLRYYRMNPPDSPRALLTQLAPLIERGEIKKTIPYRRSVAKTWSIVVWFPDETIVTQLRKYKRIAALYLNKIALERGGGLIAHLNSLDAVASEHEMRYYGGAK